MLENFTEQSGAFAELMAIRDGKPLANDEVQVTGQDNLFNTPFKVGETAAALLAARGVAANDLWQLKTGRRQKISIDMRAAAATSLAGGDMTQLRGDDGKFRPIAVSEAMKHMVSLTQPWQTADNHWLLPHTNLPHLEKRILDILQCSSSPQSVSEGVRRWQSGRLEQAIADAMACGGIVRSPEEWLNHPHGQYLAARPVVEITKIAEGKPQPLPAGELPASGIKVLDLTRILAGPTAGIGFVEHGADVLMVTAPHLPQVPAFVRDTSHGKRSCFLDMDNPQQAGQLKQLVGDADIFIDGYRPGRLEAHGFGVDELMKLRPGLIHIAVNCFGSGGPFASRAGWDQVAQAVTGICHTEGQHHADGSPRLMPVFTCDFLTGFLATFGGLVALARRATEGGSYRVQVSLCQSAMLLQRQGLLDDFRHATGRLSAAEFEQWAVYDEATCYGHLKTLGPVLQMSETPCQWQRTTPALGSHPPAW